MPYEQAASLLFNHLNFTSEMTAPGREEMNEISLKEDQYFYISLALMLWIT